MLHDVPPQMLRRMREIEARDAAERAAGAPRLERVCAVPPETGRLLALLAASAPPGRWLEIGASSGYSAMWLALAARSVGARLRTVERLPAKLAIARETIAAAGIADVVELVDGDAADVIAGERDLAFCFMDHEKSEYLQAWDGVVPRLVAGGLLAVDNVLSHADQLAGFLDHARADRRVDAVVVPIGKGVLLARA